MILVRPARGNRLTKFIKTVSYVEAAFLVGASAFIIVAFLYADRMTALADGENYVSFSRPSGFYPAPFELTLASLGRNTEIRYSVDGADPDGNSPRYARPIHIDKTTGLKVVAMRDGQPISKIQTQTYFINETSTLPVVSLTTDPVNLWDPYKGIYVLGMPDENSQEGFIPNYMQRGPAWQPPAYMEFFDAQGRRQFALVGTIKIHGHATRSFPQKSLRFCASGGQYMQYKFFEDSATDEYKCILLRNGGNDWKDTLFRDSLVQSLMSDTSLDIQHAQPAVVFLNGEYWGIYEIRDAQNDDYFHIKYGLDRDGIVIIFPDREQGGYPLVEEGAPGDEKPYVDLLRFIQENSLAEPGNYEVVKDLIDVDNYIDYLILNIYSSNNDWVDSNLRLWRYKNETGDFRDAELPYAVDGRWRWVVYDMDSAMNSSEGSRDSLDRAIHAEGSEAWTTLLFSNLLQNPEFRNQFVSRFIYHTNYTFAPDRVIARIDEYQDRLRPEIERHIAKWGGIPARSGNRWISFKDVAEWEQRVQVLRDFAVNRQDYALNQLAAQFALAGIATLHVQLSDGGTAVTIGDLRIDHDGWTGKLIKEREYPIRAESKFGYTFTGWESSVAMADATELSLSDADEVVLTAKFEKNVLGKVLTAIGIQF